MNFRDRVTIKHEVSGDDSLVQNWVDFAARLPANIISTSGGETIRGHQVAADTKFVVEMRVDTRIISEMKIYVESGVFAGRTLEIDSVLFVERRRPLRPFIMLVQCVE